MVSQGLESFLNYLRDSEQELHIAEQAELEANDATQDVLHRLELCAVQMEEAQELARKLGEIRRQRRIAKDKKDQISPVVEWLENHRAVVKELEQLLGDVRRQESRASNRIYIPKTNVLNAMEKTQPPAGGNETLGARIAGKSGLHDY